jgi:NAD(P)-dependent dehydrogenase (short-subunit alcohol dehydrogenase family)
MGELEGRHVVVTGASGGLGGAVVETFERAGAIVHAPARSQMDVGDEAAVKRYYAGRDGLWGSVHLAGGFQMAPLAETTLEDLRAQLQLNTLSAFLCGREAIAAMRRAGGGGRIVNASARAALEPVGGMVAYSVSKGAVVTLTRALAEEVRAEDILVNAVAPSIIDTPANRQAMPQADLSCWPKPAEIASAILFLASPRNRLTTGTILPVYGRA